MSTPATVAQSADTATLDEWRLSREEKLVKPSKENKLDKQAIGLLALVSGCMHTISEFGLFPGSEAAILYTKDTADKAVLAWPYNGDQRKLVKWVAKRMENYDKVLVVREGEEYHALLLTSMAIHICKDLIDKVSYRVPYNRYWKKVAAIELVMEALIGVQDLVDPKGRGEEEFTYSFTLVKLAYKEFGFKPIQKIKRR